jgi:bla regulator protein blaR1
MTIAALGAAFWSKNGTAELVNHLWQSTVVVGIAWLLALALRKNHARVRYWVWMVASVKFLLPFSVLIAAGAWLRSLLPVHFAAQPAVANAMEQIAQPLPLTPLPQATPAAIAAHHADWLPMALVAVWICGALVVAVRFGRGWWRVQKAKRAARPAELAVAVPVFLSPAPIEPGIFGILRPVLLLPEGILERLSPQQLRAVIAHEVCHLRRRDNLTFAVHMIVEVLFWFYPPVWWVGSRLIDERERACDEAVVQAGGAAQVYAEGILSVCKFYVESPVGCVTGVTGADLKQRIGRIMAEHVARRLSLGRRLLLGGAIALALTVPIMLGLVRAQSSQADDTAAGFTYLKFAVVSIRQNKSGGPIPVKDLGKPTPDGYEMRNMYMIDPILTAYPPTTGGPPFSQQILGQRPAWLAADRYDIEAKVDPADLSDWQNPAKQPAMLRAMLRNMLAERLKLEVHYTAKEEPVYLLVVGKKGPQFKPTVPGESHPGSFPAPGGGRMSLNIKGGEAMTHDYDVSIAQLISLQFHSAGRPVQDRTGLTGKYDVTIVHPQPPGAGTPEVRPIEMSPDETANQLGLKLEPSEGKVEFLVIDHVERPSPN